MQKIKLISRMNPTKIRKRDGAELTHCVHIGLTTEEALIVSDMFTRNMEKQEPTLSLIRALILLLADQDGTPSDVLVKAMASVQVKQDLAKVLSAPEVSRALSLLDNAKKAKEQPPKPKPAPEPLKVAPPKIRREYVPEPRRR